MTILVAYASRYGATAEIAERVAATLSAEGHDAVARSVTDADAGSAVEQAEAVVLGSAVYMGHWRREASEFLEQHRAALAQRPVWLFSSGPLPGAVVPERVAKNAGSDDGTPHEAPAAVAALGAREHRVFDGRLDPDRLGARDRLIRALPGGKGLLPLVDGRDWPAVEEWAREIAGQLHGEG
ncbi:MAG TPA: flavodoxin domain-containing protein [Actinotalea sp.]